MSKARDLADFVSDGSPLSDGTISVSEVSGAAPTASPNFTGDATFDTDTLAVDSTNNRVGIGTTSPSVPLEVSAGTGDAGVKVTSTTANALVTFADSTTTATTGLGAAGNEFKVIVNSNEQLRIDSSGNVGIGTPFPSSLLDVDKSQNSETNIEVSNTNTGADAQVRTKYTTDGGLFTVGKTSDAHAFGGDAYLYNVDNTNIRFATNDTERFRIGSSGELGIGGATYGTAGQVLTSGGSGAAPTWADAGGGGTADFVASGAISTGEVVSINSDGTVSVAYATGLGSNVNFNSGDIDGSARIASVYDTNSNKVVIIYNDTSNSNYLTASVGTVSGTSISFGTKVQIDTERANYMAATFDSNSNKVVIAIQKVSNSQGVVYGCTVSGTTITKDSADIFYSGQPQYIGTTFDSLNNKVIITYRDDSITPKLGKAVVCTVNASSISVGTPVAFSSSSVEYTQAIFDPNSNKVVIAWTDQNGSDRGVAVVGTVSGTSISFGSLVEYDSVSAFYNKLAFDSTNNKIIIVWRDNTLSRVGAIVATVSGTSISYGTAVQAITPNTSEFDVTYDANVQKVVLVYSDGNNTSNATVKLGTVDGTDISFSDDTYVAQTGTDGSNTQTIVYDPDQQRSVIAFRNFESTNFGTASVFTVGNGEKFIGLATENVSDTATGTFTIIGGINENQTGLSPSLNYYLSNTTDGALSSSPNTGIKIGRAISATKILVTGNA